MRTVVRLTFGVLALLAVSSAATAEVRLTILAGRVTLIAKDATVRQILAEWERVGGTKVVNADRIGGGPLTLELTNVPEQKALDVVLRSVSGVVLAPRMAAIDNLSTFERIIVMPPSATPPPSSAPAATPGTFQPPRVADDDQDERPGPAGGPQNRGGPVFAFPQPQLANPQIANPQLLNQQVPNPQMPNQPGALGGPAQQLVFPQGVTGAPPPVTAYPGVSPAVGVSVPGMVAPAPAPVPGQPSFPPPPRPQNP